MTGWRLLVVVGALFCASGCARLFPIEAGESLEHFSTQAPQPGQLAPNFVLTDIDGVEHELAKLAQHQPVVVQLGSYTCPVFRYRRFYMHPVREKYLGQVTFLVVYTQEAHPVGAQSPYSDEEWDPWINRLTGVRNPQAVTWVERQDSARAAQQAMQSNALFVVDNLDNNVWQRYGGAPSAAFLIDTERRVVLSQPWVDPEPLADAIDALLKDAPH
ncbi:MAG: deiodinase-like protein [Gammaproteobacteria bacterium]